MDDPLTSLLNLRDFEEVARQRRPHQIFGIAAMVQRVYLMPDDPRQP